MTIYAALYLILVILVLYNFKAEIAQHNNVERMKKSLDKIYTLATRELSEPIGNETGTLVEIATEIEKLKGDE